MKRILLPLCGVMLAMGSCVSTDPIDTSTDLTLSLDIFGANIPGSALAESDSVGIYFGDDYKNVEYKLSGDGVLTPVDQAIVLDTSAPQMLAAYYPYDANRTSSEYAVDITDQESIETMYWTSATSSSSKYDLEFSSLYSKLNIVASNLNSRTDMTCTLVGATAVGSFDLATGEVSTTSEDGAMFSLENVSNVAELTLNVVPCADLLNVGLKFESSNVGYSYTYYPFVKSSEWVSGDVYSYNLTLPTTNVPVESIALSMETLTIKETFSKILVATLTPANATNTSIIWSTSDNNIAHIENGVVTGVNSGVATITATSVDGKYSDTCEVTVEKYEPTIATNVDLNYGTAQTFELGRRVTFTATLTPEGTTDKRVEYDSSNTDVAIIDDDGVMSVLSEGETVITVTSISDRSVTNSCTVTVSGGEELKIGDYIYSTGDYLYSSTYTSSNVMLGIVYKVNDDKKSGKIIHKSVTKSLAWATSGTTYASTLSGVSTDDDADAGISNMKAIYNRDNLFANFPVFAYIAALNTTISDYSKLSSNATGVWYLPTNYDYEYEIFPAYWADDIAAGADSAVSTSTIGTSITNAGGTAFSYNGTSSIFVTSTEIASEVSNYRGISWRSSGADECAEASVSKSATSASNLVRAIMAFDFAE